MSRRVLFVIGNLERGGVQRQLITMLDRLNPDTIDAGFSPARHEAVASVELEGEVVVYHEQTNSTMVLNRTASTLWQCLDGTTTLAAIAADFADVYHEPVATVEADVVALARQMAEYGLFEGTEAEAGRPMIPLPSRLEESCDDAEDDG